MENTKSEHGWSLPARSSQSRRGGKTQYTIAVVTPARLASTKSETQVLWGVTEQHGVASDQKPFGQRYKEDSGWAFEGESHFGERAFLADR